MVKLKALGWTFWRIFPHRFTMPHPVWVQPWLCTRCGYSMEGHR